MSQKIVTSLPDRCTGCRQCEIICSFEKEMKYTPQLARIRVVQFGDKSLNVPVTCTYCEKPVCEEVCPTGAMTHDSETGAASVVEELCLGCKECVNACPLGAIVIHPQKGCALRCDLCGGDPACVKFCSFDALKFETTQYAAKDKRRERVEAWSLE